MDLFVSNFFYNNQSDFFNHLLSIITTLGDYGLIWIIITFLLIINRKTRKFGIICLIVLIIEFTINDIIIKELVKRPRPFLSMNMTPFIKKPSGYSFPSGHSASSIAIATLFYLNKNKYKHLVLLFAILVAFSRIYFNVHYLSDVICGGLLGYLIAKITYYLIKDKIPL